MSMGCKAWDKSGVLIEWILLGQGVRFYRALGIGLGHTVLWIRCPGLRGTRARMLQPEGHRQTACAVDTDLSDGQICMRLGSYVLYLSASIYPSIHRYIYHPYK